MSAVTMILEIQLDFNRLDKVVETEAIDLIFIRIEREKERKREREKERKREGEKPVAVSFK